MNAAPIDDPTLNAWLDGELTAERGKEVEAWLQANPEDAARVRLWAADRELLRVQFADMVDEPVPAPLEQVLWRQGRRHGAWFAAGAGPGGSRWAAAIAVFALGAALGAGLMWRVQASPPGLASATGGVEPAWVARAAVAHAVYVPEVRHPVEVKAQDEQHLSGWLTKRLNLPVKVFDLRAQGFELVGGRLLPDASGPSAQLMYQQVAATSEASGAQAAVPKALGAQAAAPGASGAPPAGPVRVTVYLRKPDRDTPAAFRYEQQGALGMFYWVEGATAQGGPCGYALVGELPRERLLAMAEAIYQQGETPTR